MNQHGDELTLEDLVQLEFWHRRDLEPVGIPGLGRGHAGEWGGVPNLQTQNSIKDRTKTSFGNPYPDPLQVVRVDRDQPGAGDEDGVGLDRGQLTTVAGEDVLEKNTKPGQDVWSH